MGLYIHVHAPCKDIDPILRQQQTNLTTVYYTVNKLQLSHIFVFDGLKLFYTKYDSPFITRKIMISKVFCFCSTIFLLQVM